MFNSEFYAQRFQVNLSVFIYRLFHEDFSSVVRINTVVDSQSSPCLKYAIWWLGGGEGGGG